MLRPFRHQSFELIRYTSGEARSTHSWSNVLKLRASEHSRRYRLKGLVQEGIDYAVTQIEEHCAGYDRRTRPRQCMKSASPRLGPVSLSSKYFVQPTSVQIAATESGWATSARVQVKDKVDHAAGRP